MLKEAMVPVKKGVVSNNQTFMLAQASHRGFPFSSWPLYPRPTRMQTPSCEKLHISGKSSTSYWRSQSWAVIGSSPTTAQCLLLGMAEMSCYKLPPYWLGRAELGSSRILQLPGLAIMSCFQQLKPGRGRDREMDGFFPSYKNMKFQSFPHSTKSFGFTKSAFSD